eukprot:1333996-Amorphochlora_amoeboformis.AAC.1
MLGLYHWKSPFKSPKGRSGDVTEGRARIARKLELHNLRSTYNQTGIRSELGRGVGVRGAIWAGTVV